MAKKTEGRKFDPKDTSTWTWLDLNKWIMGCNDQKALMDAMKLEQSKKGGQRQNYVKRIYARFRRVRARDEQKALGIPE